MSHHSHSFGRPNDVVRSTHPPLREYLSIFVHSTVCGHSYSRAAIQDFLKRSGRDGKACPASGCNKRITMDSLRADKELEKRIKIAARKQRQRAESEEDDDDEVIE